MVLTHVELKLTNLFTKKSMPVRALVDTGAMVTLAGCLADRSNGPHRRPIKPTAPRQSSPSELSGIPSEVKPDLSSLCVAFRTQGVEFRSQRLNSTHSS